jgi:hypothetical protein
MNAQKNQHQARKGQTLKSAVHKRSQDNQMRNLTFAIDITLDGCCDHTKTIGDDENLNIIRKMKIRKLFVRTFKTKWLDLNTSKGTNILVGGVSIPSQLIELVPVDEYRFVVQPIVGGEARRLLEGVGLPEKLQLKLVETKTFKSGCVALRYGNSNGKIREKTHEIHLFGIHRARQVRKHV